MFFFLPETSADNILLRRAKRLRKLTGNPNIHSQTEIDRKGIKFSSILASALIKPIEIMIKDPAVLFTNVYTSLIYGIYYSFFEVFPLVYPPIYGFNLGETGTTFLCVIVACCLASLIYICYLYFYLRPDILKNGLRAQESRLLPALFAVFGPVIGLFLFGKYHSLPVSDPIVIRHTVRNQKYLNLTFSRLDRPSFSSLDRQHHRYCHL